MAITNTHVAELQGLYGPFTMAERVVQKIWLQRDFDQSKALLTDGRTLQVRTTGVWNLLGGPDFRAAKLVMDGQPVTGDVEVHFHASDWRAHGHASDTKYDNVVLHVVLFPLGADETPALHRTGKPIPTLVLLPFLHRDLEEYASDDTLETITERDEWRFFAELAGYPSAELQLLLRAKAQQRWRQKVYFAGLRIAKLGWEDAAHHAALEVLGYKRNRSAMLTVASQYPLEIWRTGNEAAGIFAEHKILWQLHGIRPANHPSRRLLQYQHWVDACPHWPDKVVELFVGIMTEDMMALSTKAARKVLKLPERRKNIARDLTASVIGGARFDNLVCDGLLPLVTAQTGKELFPLWFHWFLGDVPDQIRRMMPKLGIADGQMQPICYGYACGLLGWFLEREARASG